MQWKGGKTQEPLYRGTTKNGRNPNNFGLSSRSAPGYLQRLQVLVQATVAWPLAPAYPRPRCTGAHAFFAHRLLDLLRLCSPSSPCSPPPPPRPQARDCAPATPQILTAYMLVALLAALPHFAPPIARVKEAFVGKAASPSSQAGGISGRVDLLSTQVLMRMLYGCLVKIDRGGWGQVVGLDM